jgi:hypothetical protein
MLSTKVINTSVSIRYTGQNTDATLNVFVYIMLHECSVSTSLNIHYIGKWFKSGRIFQREKLFSMDNTSNRKWKEVAGILQFIGETGNILL